MASKTRDLGDGLRDLVRVAEETDGWRVVSASHGHHSWAFYPADRELRPIFHPSSGSDWRGLRNLRAQLRRAGLPV